MSDGTFALAEDVLGSLALFPFNNQSRLPPTLVLVAVKRSALRMNSRRRRESRSGVISAAEGILPSLFISGGLMRRGRLTFQPRFGFDEEGEDTLWDEAPCL